MPLTVTAIIHFIRAGARLTARRAADNTFWLMVRVMVRGWLQRPVRAAHVIACAALLVSCAQAIHNEPINLPLDPGFKPAAEFGGGLDTEFQDTVIALSFSGGGTRAAAFSYGVLTGLEATPLPSGAGSGSLLDRVSFVTGVSGGSVLAAYYGLKRRGALTDFKQRFLLRNPEENLQIKLNLLSIAKGLGGGINDPTLFPKWLDDNLFNHATFRTLLLHRRPFIWINASDIYDRTPFVFGRVIFNALCSDLADYPISLAVAASAAVPVVFAPVVIQGFPGRCNIPLPDWVQRAHADPDAPPLLKLFADALVRYRSGEVRYVKLLDGGMVDNYGLAGFTIARLASGTPYGPLEPEEAVKIRRLLFIVTDAGRAPSGPWAQTVEGPTGTDLITAASDTATGSGAVGSYSAFQEIMDEWQELAGQLALQALAGRPSPLRRAEGVELPRRQILRRPGSVRATGRAARRRARRRRDQSSPAARSGRDDDRRRPRRAAGEQDVQRLLDLARRPTAATWRAGCDVRAGKPARGAGAITRPIATRLISSAVQAPTPANALRSPTPDAWSNPWRFRR